MSNPRAVLAAADLPARWCSRRRFVLLDTGFGDGGRFLACWQMWRDGCNTNAAEAASSITDAPLRQLHVVALLPRMPSADEMRDRLALADADADKDPDAAAAGPGLALELLAAWPPATPDFHRLAFDGGRVQLLLVAGALRERLPQIEAKVDTFFIDSDTLAHDADPQWPLRLFKAAGRLAVPGATLVLHGLSPTLATPAAKSLLRGSLRTAPRADGRVGPGRTLVCSPRRRVDAWRSAAPRDRTRFRQR